MNKNNVIWQLLLGYVAALGCSVSFAQFKETIFHIRIGKSLVIIRGRVALQVIRRRAISPLFLCHLQRAAGAQAQVSARVKLDPETLKCGK